MQIFISNQLMALFTAQHLVKSLIGLGQGLTENAQSPMYIVQLRYINHHFLRFGPDISTTLFYALAQIY